MKGRAMGALLAMALLAAPEVGGTPEDRGFRPGVPRPRKNGMRRAEERPWNSRAEERRRKQIERGTLRPSS